MSEELEQVLPQFESWEILSGADNAIWDEIFDWIANAISTISRVVSSWAEWLWSSVSNAISSWVSWLWDAIKDWLFWVRDQVWSRISWLRDQVVVIVDNVRSWISSTWDNLTGVIAPFFDQVWSWITWLKDTIVNNVVNMVRDISGDLSDFYAQLTGQMSSTMAWLAQTVTDRLDQAIVEIRGIVPEWIYKPGEWIQQLLDGVADWLMVDVPGHSPRWTGIFESIGNFLKTWLFDFPKWFLADVPERVAYGLSESFKWVSDTIEPIIGSFNDTILSFAKSIGPMSPGVAADNFNTIAKIGFAAIGGLTGMTVAGELLHPLKRIGLGNISAMIWDMTNYKMITGAFVGAMTYAMLRQPLNYYFNSLFRPYVLPPGDFFKLMSRDAFTDPEKLRYPELTEAIQLVAGGDGARWEREMLGWYGYPESYLGFFKELANERMGYFALAGIARAGFWDEAWFLEALSRTGYSETAKTALMGMYRELVLASRQTPVLSIASKMYREGYYNREDVQAILNHAITFDNLQDIRLYAMELSKELEDRSQAVDININAFAKGVISESECRSNLARVMKSGTAIDNNLLRKKLGLIRSVSWSPPTTTTVLEYIEE